MYAKSVAILIPAFNEECNIYEVIRKSKKYGDVIVVNDGSADMTSLVAKRGGAIVIDHTCNQGYESALNTGFQAALDGDYSYAITLDADGQHNPTIITEFLSHLNNGADVVIGRRSSLQRWSEWVFAVVCRLVWGVSDPLCGMKAYRLSSIRQPSLFDTRKLIGTELMVRMIKDSAVVAEVSVTTNVRSGNSRFGDGFQVNLRILKALLILLVYVK